MGFHSSGIFSDNVVPWSTGESSGSGTSIGNLVTKQGRPSPINSINSINSSHLLASLIPNTNGIEKARSTSITSLDSPRGSISIDDIKLTRNNSSGSLSSLSSQHHESANSSSFANTQPHKPKKPISGSDSFLTEDGSHLESTKPTLKFISSLKYSRSSSKLSNNKLKLNEFKFKYHELDKANGGETHLSKVSYSPDADTICTRDNLSRSQIPRTDQKKIKSASASKSRSPLIKKRFTKDLQLEIAASGSKKPGHMDTKAVDILPSMTSSNDEAERNDEFFREQANLLSKFNTKWNRLSLTPEQAYAVNSKKRSRSISEDSDD